MIKRLKGFALILLAGFSISPVNANESIEIKPFNAVYDMYRQGDKLGQGNRSLVALGNDKYTLELNSKIEWFIFSDKRKESSILEFKNNQAQPISYNFERTGTGKDKSLLVDFRPNNELYVNPKASSDPAPATWKKGWLDELTLHLQVQADLMQGKTFFEYELISSSGKLKSYQLEVIGNEIISTGMGRFNAVKVARVYGEDRKFYALHAWFVPELNYTLARMWRMKKGVEQYDLVLNKYQPIDTPITLPINK